MLMLNVDSPLILEFLKDHQQFARLLLQISKLLDQGQIEEARNRARELDELAGPHIAYEEAELYPRLASLGEREVTEETLVDQHHDALQALRMLIDHDSANPQQLEAIQVGFRHALEHVEHCGSLISLMSQLDEDQQAASLSELKRLRDHGPKWTDYKP